MTPNKSLGVHPYINPCTTRQDVKPDFSHGKVTHLILHLMHILPAAAVYNAKGRLLPIYIHMYAYIHIYIHTYMLGKQNRYDIIVCTVQRCIILEGLREDPYHWTELPSLNKYYYYYYYYHYYYYYYYFYYYYYYYHYYY